MGNMIASMIVYAILFALCFYVARTWVRGFRSKVRLAEPRRRSGVTVFGFGLTTASLTDHRRARSSCCDNRWASLLSSHSDACHGHWYSDSTSWNGGCLHRNWPARKSDNRGFRFVSVDLVCGGNRTVSASDDAQLLSSAHYTHNHAFSSANIAARRMAAISFRKLLISSSLSRR